MTSGGGVPGPRNGKLDPVVFDRIAEALRTGVSLEAAAEYAGVPRSTFFDWLARGRRPQSRGQYKKLAEMVEEALAHFEVHALARITKAGEKEWTADAWRLERIRPDRYGRRTRIDGQVQVQAVPFADLSKLTLDEQRQLVALLEKAQPNQEQLQPGQRPALELLPGGELIEG